MKERNANRSRPKVLNNMLRRITTREYKQVTNRILPDAYSPDGPVRTDDNTGGTPKFGVLFEFQLTFWAIVYLRPSQAPLVTEVAW